MCPFKYNEFAGSMPISRDISCDHFSKRANEVARSDVSRLMTYLDTSNAEFKG